jgi:mitogen-activated protein kinase 15
MDPSDIIETRILEKYKILSKLGKGTYAQVWEASAKRLNFRVAIKKICDAFLNPIDAQRTFREVFYLLELRHPNIVRIFNVHRARNDHDLYLVLECMDRDLHMVIRSGAL